MYGIFIYIWGIFGANVGKYSSTMEHMGKEGYPPRTDRLRLNMAQLCSTLRFPGKRILSWKWRETLGIPHGFGPKPGFCLMCLLFFNEGNSVVSSFPFIKFKYVSIKVSISQWEIFRIRFNGATSVAYFWAYFVHTIELWFFHVTSWCIGFIPNWLNMSHGCIHDYPTIIPL